jgi:hypothetical protein
MGEMKPSGRSRSRARRVLALQVDTIVEGSGRRKEAPARWTTGELLVEPRPRSAAHPKGSKGAALL